MRRGLLNAQTTFSRQIGGIAWGEKQTGPAVLHHLRHGTEAERR